MDGPNVGARYIVPYGLIMCPPRFRRRYLECGSLAAAFLPLTSLNVSEVQQLKTSLAAIRVVLHVDGLVHRGGCGVGFFINVDGSGMLQRGADVVEPL